MQPLKYKIEVKLITLPGDVPTDGANAVLFVNRGTAIALVNNEQIAENQFVSNSGLQGEIDTTKYKVQWTGGGSRRVYCKIKTYVP